MSSQGMRAHRILAIAPKSRGFGFIVMEDHTSPIDWGVRRGQGSPIDIQIILVGKIQDLVKHYQPNSILLEKWDERSRRGDRVRLLSETVRNTGVWEHVRVRTIESKRIRKTFLAFNAFTKHEIAIAISQQLPELAPRLPPSRKPWMAEDQRMAIFDAAALALTYFYARLTIA